MYRRSVLGQFWITLSMAVTFAAIGAVFGLIFQSPVIEYLPFLGCGLVFFNFLSVIINEGSTSFIASEPFIRQLPLSPLIYFMRSVWKAFFVLLHNAVALVILLAIFPPGVSWATLLVLPGLLVSGAATCGLALALAMLSTRYRDVPQITAAVVQVLFYLTPILWLPSSLPEAARDVILRWNPFYPLIEVMRAPILNQYPTPEVWTTAILLAVVLVTGGLAAYFWKRRQLPFWV